MVSSPTCGFNDWYSLHIKFHYLNWCRLKRATTWTQPHLYVVRGGGGKVLSKPRGINRPIRIIATGIGGATPLSIPEGFISVQYSFQWVEAVTDRSITVVVISNETWNSRRWAYIGVDTRAFRWWVAYSFISCSCKCPNVFAWALTMSKTHSIDIWLVNSMVFKAECTSIYI
jgi:hypothetical protein